MTVKEAVFELAPADAVRVAVCVVLTEVVEAVKLALVDPEATVTEAGTVTAALLSASVTGVPPVGAAALNVTVQVELAGAITDAGEQLTVLMVGCHPCTVIVPAVPDNVLGPPAGKAPSR